MKRGRVAPMAMLVLLALLAVGVVALAAGTDEPTKVMSWIVAVVTPLICVPVIQIVKGIIVRVVGEGLTSMVMKYLAWGLSYVIAVVAYIIGGALSGVNGLQAILTGGWTTLITGAVPVLANAAYLLVEGKLAESVATKLSKQAKVTKRK